MNVDVEVCFVCNEGLSAEVVKCDGVCNRSAHARCIKITKTVHKALQEIDNLSYVCDICSKDTCKAINAKLNKIMSMICIYDERVTRNEKNMDNLVEQIGELKALVNQKVVPESVENVEIISTNRKSKTYAEKVKMCNNDSVLMVKPKKPQNSSATETDLKNLIDPTKIKFNNLKKLPNGCLAIECGDIIESEEVKKVVNEKMSENYVISIPELKNPRVKIIGIRDQVNDTELIDSLKNQNAFLTNGNIKVINIFKTRYENLTAIVELDSASFEECMKARKLKIRWSICTVIEDLNVFRCFKCQGYNHKHNNCTNNLACKRCAEKHSVMQCNSIKEVCVNCKIANEKYNLRLNTNHAVNNEICAVYQKRIKTERRNIKYSK